jgi:hypothetical protein
MPNPFFNIEMLPAKHGDALLVEYGNERKRRILIDGGPLDAYPELSRRLEALPQGDQAVELLVVTHVDTDHIEGIIRLLAMPEPKWPIQVGEIWFNGWRHLEESGTLGGLEGEFMSALIHQRANDRWNASFDRKAVRCGVLPDDAVVLADGMKLTMLSPDAPALAALLKDWKASLRQGTWKMDPGDLEAAWERLVETSKFHPGSELTLGADDLTERLRRQLRGTDASKANRSSIAFLAEFGGKSCLFLGDANMRVVCDALKRRGYSKAKPLRVDAVKVSHHGSKRNTTPEFLDLVDAANWLFSTNGAKHDHPNPETVEAIIAGSTRRPTLWFNYKSRFTEKWEQGAQAAGARYDVRYPAPGREGLVVPL